MVKKTKLFTSRLPRIRLGESEVKPDLMLVLKDGKPRVACWNEAANLQSLIRLMESYLDELKDERWRRNNIIAKKK